MLCLGIGLCLPCSQPLLEGQEGSLTGKGGLGPFVWAPRVLARYSSASPLSQFVVNCNSIQSMPTITFVISGSPLPLPPSTYVLNVRMHSGLHGHGIGWAQTAVPCPRSCLDTYGESPVAGLRVNKKPEDPASVMEYRVGTSCGERLLYAKMLYPYVFCLFRTMVTAPLGLRPPTCPPPVGSPCGLWEMSSSRNITLSMTWATIEWALPSLSRQVRGSCLHPHCRTLGLPYSFSGLTAAF